MWRGVCHPGIPIGPAWTDRGGVGRLWHQCDLLWTLGSYLRSGYWGRAGGEGQPCREHNVSFEAV